LNAIARIWETCPRTNDGVAMTSSERAVTTRSERRYCRVAVQAPKATPSVRPSMVPSRSSLRLTHMRTPISSLTDTPRGE